MQGRTGDVGNNGQIGMQGPKGEKGDTGLRGEKGDKGDAGLRGEKGDKGEDGATSTVNLGLGSSSRKDQTITLIDTKTGDRTTFVLRSSE
jgi:hypothetical protein